MTLRALLYTPAGSPRAGMKVAGFIALVIVLSIPGALMFAPALGDSRISRGVGMMSLSSVVDVLAALGATWIMIRRVDRKSLDEVGLGRSGASPRLVAGGFLIGALAIALPIILLIALGWLRQTRVILAPSGHPLLTVTMLLLPAAFSEELITRGYVLTVLKDAWNWPVAVVSTSVVFGLMHLANAGVTAQSVVLVMLAGVFLASVRIATGSLYAAWAAHFAWNWVMVVVFHAPVSGYTFDAPGYRYVDSGPDWATGGAWGPEGGALAGLAMIGGTGLLLARIRRRPFVASLLGVNSVRVSGDN